MSTAISHPASGAPAARRAQASSRPAALSKSDWAGKVVLTWREPRRMTRFAAGILRTAAIAAVTYLLASNNTDSGWMVALGGIATIASLVKATGARAACDRAGSRFAIFTGGDKREMRLSPDALEMVAGGKTISLPRSDDRAALVLHRDSSHRSRRSDGSHFARAHIDLRNTPTPMPRIAAHVVPGSSDSRERALVDWLVDWWDTTPGRRWTETPAGRKMPWDDTGRPAPYARH